MPKRTPPPDPAFPFGFQYYRAPTPLPSEWEGDLKRIRAVGATVVQLRAQWRWHERVRGDLVWTDLDRLFDLCEAVGLHVVFKFQLETAPAFVFTEHDGYQMDGAGNRLPPAALGSNYVGGVMPCFDKSAVREAARPFVTTAVDRYKDRPALLAWNVWNEPRRRGRSVCSCPESLAAYRAWLADRFGAVEKFNARFGKAFGSYDEVAGPVSVRDYLEAWLFRQWTMEDVADQVRWIADLVRRFDGAHPVMSHVGLCLPIQDVLDDSSDGVLNAAVVDRYGSSFPHWTGDFHGYADIEGQATFASNPEGTEFYIYPLIADWVRSITPDFWINEIYGNTWWVDTPDFEPEDLAVMTCSALAGGAKGILYWQYRSERLGEESFGAGLTDVAGRPTPRSKAVAAIATAVQESPETFRDWQPDPADVAILYDRDSDLLSRIENASAAFAEQTTVKYRYKQVLKGLYAMLWRANVAADFLDARRLDALKRYKVLLAGAATIIDGSRAKALAAFVKAGGTLIVEPGFASRDPRTWLCPQRPAGGLAKLTATEELDVKRIEPGNRSLVFEDLELPVAGVLSRLTTTLREPVATWADETPAIVEHEVGTGRCITLGVHPALCFAGTDDAGWVEFLRRLLGRTGVAPVVETHQRAWVRIGTVGKQPAAFCFNYEADDTILLLDGFGRRSEIVLGAAELLGSAEGLHIQLPPRSAAFIVDRRSPV